MSYYKGSRNYVTKIDINGRVCTLCKSYKEWKLFPIAKKTKAGFASVCKQCKNAGKRSPRDYVREKSSAREVRAKLKKDDPYEYKSRLLRSSLLARSKGREDLRNSTPSKLEIKEWLKSQELKCYYTNEPVTLHTLHIDHKKPIGRGGLNHLSNLCITTPKANTAKGGLTEEEFKSLLSLVSTWEDKGASLFNRLRQGFYS